MPDEALQKSGIDTRPISEIREKHDPEFRSRATSLEVLRPAKSLRPSSFGPTNLNEAIQFSKMIADSDLAPRDFKGKPANVLIALQMGAEVGLPPMQALQNIAVINGRPCLWGDAALAVVQVHPAYEWHKEWIEGSAMIRVAVFQIKRKGQDVHETRFSVEQAKQARLWDKDGPWKTYPERMLQMRARGFGLRDKFSDGLKGLILAEEAADIPLDDMRDTLGQDTRLAEKSNAKLDEVKARYAAPAPVAQAEVVHTEPAKSEPVAQSVVTDEVPAKQLETMTVTVLKVDAKSKAINAKQKEENLKRKPEAQHEPQPYFILKCEDDISIFVWDKHLFTAILKSQKKKCVFGVAKNDKGFITLEDIIEIAGVKFALDPETKDAVPAELLGMTQRASERMEAGQSAAPPNPGLLEISGKVTSFRKTDANGKPLKAVSGPSYVTITLAYLDADTTHDPHQLFVCKNEHLFSVLEMSDEEDITFVYSKKTDAKHVLWQSIEDVKKVGNRTFENGKPSAEDEDQSVVDGEVVGIEGLFDN